MASHSITLTDAQLSIISNALIQLPYMHAAPVIDSINKQIQQEFDARVDESTPSGAVEAPNE